MILRRGTCVKHHNMYAKTTRSTTTFSCVCFDYGELFEDGFAQNRNCFAMWVVSTTISPV